MRIQIRLDRGQINAVIFRTGVITHNQETKRGKKHNRQELTK
jgi:hypothetical protein